MMAVYQTYKEAVLANGSTKGVYSNLMTGWFQIGISHPGSWAECNPADYLETLESFLASGKRLVKGDSLILLTGYVAIIEYDEEEAAPTSKSDMNSERFVLHSAADQMETPEEKEAFDSIPNQATIDAMNSEAENGSYNSASEAFDAIDTTPKQVESLGKCQESSDGIEWENGDLASLKSCGAELRVIGPDPYSPNHIFCLETAGNGEALYYHKSLLETPAEREQRERDEMAKQLMIDMHGKGVFDKRDWNHQKKYSLSAQQAFSLIDAGYRKQ